MGMSEKTYIAKGDLLYWLHEAFPEGDAGFSHYHLAVVLPLHTLKYTY